MFMKPLALSCAFSVLASVGLADPLPSWNAGAAKSRVMDFVESVVDPASDSYVTPADRIAVFDNDGTLWAEQPIYFQVIFALAQVQKLARENPDAINTDALRAAAAGDLETLVAGGKAALGEILLASHAGMTAEAFQQDVTDWLNTARHPDTGLRYDDMIYQPMLELLRYLRDEGFETYIVSGGGIDFMRVFAERAYGITPENVIGTALKASYAVVDGVPTITKEGELFFFDDKEGKPVGIYQNIGKRPILAGGNSDGDFQMLEYTTAGDGERLGLYVHHTDGDREWAYDREGHVGVLNRGLDEAEARGWVLIDMAQDWSRIFPATAR